ncbi:MAG: cytochrome c [Afipia sp.]|jgi:cytochrome c556|nr:cytochrome c [Afipia sp.]MBS4003489.1 cytochrome c [Afipia sp.]MBS4006030.1 cytochrome c [Afipia sp.]WIG49995.1 MAG: Cytochrome c [Afipia sp.]
MMRSVLVAAAILLGVTAVSAQQDIAEQQDKLMKTLARPMYGVLGRTVRGQSAYDQAAIDAALVQLEENVGKIANVFAVNPKEDVFGADYGSSQKIWQNKADFDSKIPPVAKSIADAKGKIKDADSLKAAYTTINDRCNDCHETYRVKLK